MKLWKKPRLAAALCAVVVLVCAAAPAVFLSVVDAASLGHSQAVADPYTAPTPTADDYYLLRQLSARQLTQSKYTFQPGDTGQVYSFWLSTPADSAAAHDPESLPKEAALRAFADQAGLTSLGDWTWREDLTYPRAIYSLNGQALVAAASGAYTVNDYFTYSGATSDRWYVSIELSLCAEANLPLRMQDDTTNLEKEANPNA